MKTPLTLQQQIEVLEKIDWKNIKNNELGLCTGIQDALNDVLSINVFYSNLSEFIPLFTFKNSRKFSFGWEDMYTMYWFPKGNKGYKQRKAFVDWMIEELKKQIKPSLFRRIINKLKHFKN